MKQIAASRAKNNFGGLLDDVATLGCVEIVKHGRPVAVVLSPRALDEVRKAGYVEAHGVTWGDTHMIPPDRARAARRVGKSADFDAD